MRVDQRVHPGHRHVQAVAQRRDVVQPGQVLRFVQRRAHGVDRLQELLLRGLVIAAAGDQAGEAPDRCALAERAQVALEQRLEFPGMHVAFRLDPGNVEHGDVDIDGPGAELPQQRQRVRHRCIHFGVLGLAAEQGAQDA